MLEELTKVFEGSEDAVVITNRSFEIIWKNPKAANHMMFSQNSCRELFKDAELPLKSGSHTVIFHGLAYECHVVSCPEPDDIYLIQTDGDDILCSFLKNRIIRETFENHSGSLRSAISGITMTNYLIENIFKEQHSAAGLKYTGIISGNCCKLLKFVLNTLELTKYSEDQSGAEILDLSMELKKFVDNSRRTISRRVMIHDRIADELYIKANAERLETFLIALLVMVRYNDPKNDIIYVEASKDGSTVTLKMSSEQSGCTRKPSREYSEYVELYSDEQLRLDLMVVNRFCKAYSGSLRLSDPKEKTRSASISFPSCTNEDTVFDLSSKQPQFDEGIYSKYNILYSDIIF